MKILRLYIHNNGVFKNTLIDFTHDGKAQDLICLAGINGSGKTTVMELILNLINFINPNLSLRNIFYDKFKPNILTRIEFSQLDILVDGKILSLVLGKEEYIQVDKEYAEKQSFIIECDIKNMIKYFEDNFVKTSEKESDIISKEYHWIEKKFFNRTVKRKNVEIFEYFFRKIENAYEETKKEIIQDMPVVYFLNARNREILDVRYNSIPQEKLEYEITHRYSPKKDDLKKTLIFYDYAIPEEFEKLKTWINENALVDKSISRIDRINFEVIIETKSGREHGLECLSSGEESILIIATQLYLRASKYAIFLIDEIDRSLHPEFQEKVMKLIKQLQIQKDKGCQIFVSSHSKTIWDAFEEKGFISLTELVI